jgi:hypothetical protein
MLERFLKAYFPVPSPYEVADHRNAIEPASEPQRT